MHTGERQAAKMRMAYLKSMLNQDISLFDTEASTGEVISAITSDIIIVQDALSEKVHIHIYIPNFVLFKLWCYSDSEITLINEFTRGKNNLLNFFLPLYSFIFYLILILFFLLTN